MRPRRRLLGGARRQMPHRFGALPLERIVVAAIGFQLQLIDVQDDLRHHVQQAAVMADQQDGGGVGLQEALQPQGGFEVQMVGRLVEQQQVWLGRQRRGERHAHPPAAGKGFARAALRLLVEAQPRKNDGGAGRGAVGIDGQQPLVHLGQLFRIVLGLGLRQQLHALAVGHQHGFQQRLIAIRSFLRDRADAGAAVHRDIAALGVQLPQDQLHQRRFAKAVAPDQRHLMAGIDAGGRILEQGAVADAVGDVFNR